MPSYTLVSYAGVLQSDIDLNLDEYESNDRRIYLFKF